MGASRFTDSLNYVVRYQDGSSTLPASTKIRKGNIMSMIISQGYMEEYVINPLMKKLAIMERKMGDLEKKVDALNFNFSQHKKDEPKKVK